MDQSFYLHRFTKHNASFVDILLHLYNIHVMYQEKLQHQIVSLLVNGNRDQIEQDPYSILTYQILDRIEPIDVVINWLVLMYIGPRRYACKSAQRERKYVAEL
jgi:hypothetical protein